MARLHALPSRAIISGLRGAIDFYQWLGLPVARSWPRQKTILRSPTNVAAQQVFTYVNTITTSLSPEVIATWQALASQSNMTWRDWLNRAYLGGTLTAPGMPPL